MKILSLPLVDNLEIITDRSQFNFVEYRLDYSTDRQDLSFLPALSERTIITLRDISEGGKEQIPVRDKLELYRQLIEKYNLLVDVELTLYSLLKPKINPKNLILSRHLSSKTTDISKKVRATIESGNSFKSAFLKIVAPLNTYRDFQSIKELIKQSRNPVIFVGTGKLGKLSRILWREIGSQGTYLGLPGYKTAEEQLTPDEYNLFRADKISPETQIGGLIGGDQVQDSLGINHYNNTFLESGLDAVYLPLPVGKVDDFLAWLKLLNKSYSFYGFSVTMPHKKSLAEILCPGLIKPINLISTDKGKLTQNRPKLLYNSDEYAFRKSLCKLGIPVKAKILVIGSGATAETLLQLLSKNENVTIAGRDRDKLSLVAEKYQRKYFLLPEGSNQRYDLIVNCTPIGMQQDNLFKVADLTLPVSFIDLPYRTDEPTEAIKSCLSQKIPFVDGATFWQYQAELQTEVFFNNIKAKDNPK